VIFAIRWHPAAEAALLNLRHWRTAAKIDAGVIRFARTGEGDIRSAGPHWHLYVDRFVVRLAVDKATLTIMLGFHRGWAR
jgi:hypothetical protein